MFFDHDHTFIGDRREAMLNKGVGEDEEPSRVGLEARSDDGLLSAPNPGEGVHAAPGRTASSFPTDTF